MTQVGELISPSMFGQLTEEKCPFKLEPAENITEEEEDGPDDTQVTAVENNSGGVLGDNLANGTHGKAGTVGGDHCLEPVNGRPREDTARKGVKVSVKGAGSIEDGEFPFTVAAHHLIPGKASLVKSQLYKKFMVKGSVTSKGGNTVKINQLIGYNVNGAHNGVWLPGNYAIRAGTEPLMTTWSAVAAQNPEWALNYVFAAMKKAGGQFHDAHTVYNKFVLKLLNKYSVRLFAHLDSCDDCKSKTDVSPPYVVKRILYSLSKRLRGKVTGSPASWKPMFFTTDKWRELILANRTRM